MSYTNSDAIGHILKIARASLSSSSSSIKMLLYANARWMRNDMSSRESCGMLSCTLHVARESRKPATKRDLYFCTMKTGNASVFFLSLKTWSRASDNLHYLHHRIAPTYTRSSRTWKSVENVPQSCSQINTKGSCGLSLTSFYRLFDRDSWSLKKERRRVAECLN